MGMEIGVLTVIVILIAHFLGDFVLQTDRQAKQKSSSWLALGEHVFTYSTTLLSCLATYLAACHLFSPNVPAFGSLVSLWVLLNGACHFFVDAATSRINSKLYAGGRIHAFFVGVGADQLIHTSLLIWTAELFLLGVPRVCFPDQGIPF